MFKVFFLRTTMRQLQRILPKHLNVDYKLYKLPDQHWGTMFKLVINNYYIENNVFKSFLREIPF